MATTDPVQLAAQIVALFDDASPDRFRFDEATVAESLGRWKAVKSELIALSATDDDPEVRRCTEEVLRAGDGLFDHLANWRPRLRFSQVQDLVSAFPEARGQAKEAANKLLATVS
jgi:Fe-S-cluster formation regulator IscX/YfhJ